MALIDLDLSSVATELLTSDVNLGYISLKRETGGVLDPITGGYTDGTIEIIPIAGGVKDIPDSLYDGTRVKKGDVMVVTDNKIKPLMTDKLVIDAREFTIVDIDDRNHSGITQVYNIQGRK